MTVPASPTAPIGRADAATQFRQQITSIVNTLAVWYAESHPGGADPIGGKTLQSATPSTLAAALRNGQIATNGPLTSSMPTGNVSVATLTAVLTDTAQMLSRVRRTRLVKYYSNTEVGTNAAVWDQTQYAHLSAAYQISSTGVTPPTPGTDATAASYNQFVNNLQAAIAAHRETAVLFTEQWCHTNCHTNHSSRGRR